MSIINKVLRDIDQRNALDSKTDFNREALDENGYPKEDFVPLPAKSKINIRQTVVLLVMLVVVAVFGYPLLDKLPQITSGKIDETAFFDPSQFEESKLVEQFADRLGDALAPDDPEAALGEPTKNGVASQGSAKSTAKQELAQATAVSKIVPQQAAPAPIKMLKVVKEAIDGGVRVTFPLTGSPNSSIRKTEGQIDIVMPNTILVKPVDRLVDKMGLIKQVSINTTKNDLSISFSFNPEASMQNYAVRYDDGEDFIIELIAPVKPIVESPAKQQLVAATNKASSTAEQQPGLGSDAATADPFAIDQMVGVKSDFIADARRNDNKLGDGNSNSISKTMINDAQKDQKQYENALMLIRERKIREAIDTLSAFVSMHTVIDKSLTLLADILIKQGMEDKFVDILDSLNLQDKVIHSYLMARVLAAKGNYQSAIDEMEKRSVIIAGNEDYFIYLAGLYQKTGRFEKAVTLYKRLAKIINNNPSVWLGLAVSADAMSDYRVALLAFNNAQQFSYGSEIDDYIGRRVKYLSNQ